MKILSRIFLLIFFLSSSFLLANNISLKEVVDRLTYHHGPEWKKLVKSENDQRQIRQHLQVIIDKKINYRHSEFKDYKLWASHIYESAIGELGNFTSVDATGGKRTFDQLKNIHQEYLKDQKYNSHEPGVDSFLTSLYQSISSVGTPEALDYLTNELGRSETYDYSLMEMINQNLAGTENLDVYKTDFDPNLEFTPNIEKSYHERPGNWKKSIKKFRLKLASYRNKRGVSSSLRQFARATNFRTAEIVNGTLNTKDKIVSTDSNEKKVIKRIPSSDSSSNFKQDQDYYRSPSQIEETQTKDESNYLLKVALIIFLSTVAFWFLFLRKK